METRNIYNRLLNIFNDLISVIVNILIVHLLGNKHRAVNSITDINV